MRTPAESARLERKPQIHCSQLQDRGQVPYYLGFELPFGYEILPQIWKREILGGRWLPGDNSYNKASEKVLPQTPKTSRWRQTSIIHKRCRVSLDLGGLQEEEGKKEASGYLTDLRIGEPTPNPPKSKGIDQKALKPLENSSWLQQWGRVRGLG